METVTWTRLHGNALQPVTRQAHASPKMADHLAASWQSWLDFSDIKLFVSWYDLCNIVLVQSQHILQ